MPAVVPPAAGRPSRPPPAVRDHPRRGLLSALGAACGVHSLSCGDRRPADHRRREANASIHAPDHPTTSRPWPALVPRRARPGGSIHRSEPRPSAGSAGSGRLALSARNQVHGLTSNGRQLRPRRGMPDRCRFRRQARLVPRRENRLRHLRRQYLHRARRQRRAGHPSGVHRFWDGVQRVPAHLRCAPPLLPGR